MDALLQQAFGALQSGRLAAAEAACRSMLAARPRDAVATHLLGLVQRQLGRAADAEQLLRRSVELAPQNPEFRSNLASLLGALGRHAEAIGELQRAIAAAPRFRPARLALARMANQTGAFALGEREARELLAADPRDGEAWSALGAALYGQRRIAAAREAFESAVRLAPGYGAARYHLAAALCEEERAEEALEHAEAAARLGIGHRGLALTRARVLMQLDRYGEAETLLEELVRASPEDAEAQFLLAQLRHVRGDMDFARALREAADRPAAGLGIRVTYADVMRRSGRLEIAERVLRALIEQHGPQPALASALATVLQESQRFAEAADVARSAASAQPDDAAVAENLVAALLSTGEAREALPVIERFRGLAPLDQRWITYRIDAARQLDDAGLVAEWGDVERLVRVYDLPIPPGYASRAEFLEALAAALRERHRQRLHPLDQSMRLGTQTSRGLLVNPDPAIRAFLASLAEPLADYQAAIGRDASHPLLSRNLAPARPVGCWSVQLRRGGYHVNHIHPQGWISSAFYVRLPAVVEDPALRSGWIKFGEPLHAMPQGQPRRFVQPRAGRLVLFPSYMWHGTTPIHGEEPRLTIAFDAVPAPSG